MVCLIMATEALSVVLKLLPVSSQQCGEQHRGQRLVFVGQRVCSNTFRRCDDWSLLAAVSFISGLFF